MRAPPWARGDGPAAERWSNTVRATVHVRDVLRRATALHLEEPEELRALRATARERRELKLPRYRSRVAELELEDADGRRLVLDVPDARHLLDDDSNGGRFDWRADPGRSADRLDSCARGWAVRVSGFSGSPCDRWSAAPLRCTDPICPMCVAWRGYQRAKRYAPVLTGLARRGYLVVHLTDTQQADPTGAVYPVAYTADDRRRLGDYRGLEAAPGELARSVPGETLGQALRRYDARRRLLRDSRRKVDGEEVRSWWGRTVVVDLAAREATQRSPTGALRWHVHGHALLVLPPGALSVAELGRVRAHGGALWTADGRPLCRWAARYLRTLELLDPTASRLAQHARLVEAGAEEELDGVLSEVLKYPAKVASMTDAGVLEWLVTTRGTRPSVAGGALHGATPMGRAANAIRWATREPGVEASEEELERWRSLVARARRELRLPAGATAAELLRAAAVAWTQPNAAHPLDRRAALEAHRRYLSACDVGEVLAECDEERARRWASRVDVLEVDGAKLEAPRLLTCDWLEELLRDGVAELLVSAAGMTWTCRPFAAAQVLEPRRVDVVVNPPTGPPECHRAGALPRPRAPRAPQEAPRR